MIFASKAILTMLTYLQNSIVKMTGIFENDSLPHRHVTFFYFQDKWPTAKVFESYCSILVSSIKSRDNEILYFFQKLKIQNNHVTKFFQAWIPMSC